MLNQPPFVPEGEPLLGFYEPKLITNNHEFVIGAQLVSHRELFGLCYQSLLTDYYVNMPRDSGAMVTIFLPMQSLLPSVGFPGDIDLLIIPYESDKLILSYAMAVELKVVRAKFSNQGKSPNEFGFSQAKGLLDIGFPYVGLAHMIVSDQSPPDHHEEMSIARIVDTDSESVEFSGKRMMDMMPMRLMERSFGRLKANCQISHLGLLASYIHADKRGYWFPIGRSALKNPNSSLQFQEKLGEFYQSNVDRFINIPKFPKLNLKPNELSKKSIYDAYLLHEEVKEILLFKKRFSN